MSLLLSHQAACNAHVRFWHLADNTAAPAFVRFWTKADIDIYGPPVLTND